MPFPGCSALSGHQTDQGDKMLSSTGGFTLAKPFVVPDLIRLSLTAPWPILLRKDHLSHRVPCGSPIPS